MQQTCQLVAYDKEQIIYSAESEYPLRGYGNKDRDLLLGDAAKSIKFRTFHNHLVDVNVHNRFGGFHNHLSRFPTARKFKQQTNAAT